MLPTPRIQTCEPPVPLLSAAQKTDIVHRMHDLMLDEWSRTGQISYDILRTAAFTEQVIDQFAPTAKAFLDGTIKRMEG